MENDDLTKIIIHYQQGIEKYSQRNDEAKILHCISKLHKLPINVQHLELTGVGRTVNSLRKINGKVGDSAKLLVTKWKEMVMEESDEQTNTKVEEEPGDQHKKPSNSLEHKENDKKNKFVESEVYSYPVEKNGQENEKKSTRQVYDKPSSSKRKLSVHDSDEDEDVNEIPEKYKHKSSKHHSHRNKKEDESSHKKNKSDSKHSSPKGKKEESNKKYQTESRKLLEDDSLDHQLMKKKREEKHSTKHKKEKREHKTQKLDSSIRETVNSSKNVTESKDKNSKHESKKHKSKSAAGNEICVENCDIGENGIGTGSGASFEEALGMLGPGSSKSKKKIAIQSVKPGLDISGSFKDQELGLLSESKLEPLNINVTHLLPDITPNYRPIGNMINEPVRNKVLNDDETLVKILNTKITRTKVFSGNKTSYGKVPSLFNMCIRILQDNIDSLEVTGGVPYDILKPVLERANADQLQALEYFNSYLLDDTDELWKFHCQKEFRNKRREEMESWRDMYMRCLLERSTKLKALTANIKLSQDKSVPVRQTKLAYIDGVAKPDRSVLRKQAKFGTGTKETKPLVTPSARLAKIVSASMPGQAVVPNTGHRMSNTGGSSSMKPKKAPLMQKTLSFMKNRQNFRR